MVYNITKYSFDQAKKLGVDIKPSTVKNKKIDVFRDGIKIASIGDIRYSDFATTGNKDQRRRFKLRFNKSRKVIGSNSYWSDQLLW
jgi:hypothetical protein